MLHIVYLKSLNFRHVIYSQERKDNKISSMNRHDFMTRLMRLCLLVHFTSCCSGIKFNHPLRMTRREIRCLPSSIEYFITHSSGNTRVLYACVRGIYCLANSTKPFPLKVWANCACEPASLLTCTKTFRSSVLLLARLFWRYNLSSDYLLSLFERDILEVN